jgi:hypothetical protein
VRSAAISGGRLLAVQRHADPGMRADDLPVVEQTLQVGVECQRAQTFVTALASRGEDLRDRLLAAVDLFTQQQQVLLQFGVIAMVAVRVRG